MTGPAAVFVVLNHIFERAWPGYPRQSRSVLGGLDDLRPVRGHHVHRAVLQQAMSARLWQLRRTVPGVVAGHSRG